MSRSRLRPAAAPHTNKPPGACPHCGSRVISRKGVRKKKLEIVQLWRCGSCKRIFTPGPAALRNKTYPIRLVLKALTLYNLGYSLNETAKRLKSKSGRTVSPSTIATWIGARNTAAARTFFHLPTRYGSPAQTSAQSRRGTKTHPRKCCRRGGTFIDKACAIGDRRPWQFAQAGDRGGA